MARTRGCRTHPNSLTSCIAISQSPHKWKWEKRGVISAMLETRQGRVATTWDRESSEVVGKMPRSCVAYGRKIEHTFLDAVGTWKHSRAPGRERREGVDQCSALARTLVCVPRDGGGGLPGFTHLSFNLESVDPVRRAMNLRIRDELDCTFCTLRKRALRSFVLGLGRGSGPLGSGLVAWEVV